MRILEVYKDIYPFVQGGIERYVHDLSAYLSGRGNEVEVLVAGDSSATGAAENLSFSVRGTPCICRILSNPICPDLTNEFRSSSADITHFHVPLPSAVVSWMMSRNRGSYIVTYHSDIIRQAAFLPLYGPVLRRFLARAGRVLVTSEAYRISSPFLNGLSNVSTVPIGVDLSRFCPGTAKPSREYWLFVGRFRAYKGIDVLLETWSHFPGRKLVMVGGGPMRERILAARSSGGLNIEIVDDPDDAALVELYRNARCLILPSTLRSEAYGMVQTEAMACGTPVISTELGTGVSWVNRHGVSGLVVEPGNADALAAAVNEMDDPGRLSELAEGALERARKELDSISLFQKVEAVMEEERG